jgi:hypothetical protein
MACRPETKRNGVLPLRNQGEGFVEGGNAVNLINVHPEPGCHHFEGFLGEVFIPILNVVKDADEGCSLLLIFVNDQIN